MPRLSEMPVIEKVEGHPVVETVETHPAYGMIGASRISSTPGHYLNGTDFQHRHFISISIRKAVKHRNLSNDWNFANEELVEVYVSEAQWAAFVSSMNVGNGVPCTLSRFDGNAIPAIEACVSKKDEFKSEIANHFKEALSEIDQLLQSVQDSSASAKVKNEVASRVNMIRNKIVGGAEYVPDQFEEHMERKTEAAKCEANAYLLNAVQRAGLTALGAPETVLLGEDNDR